MESIKKFDEDECIDFIRATLSKEKNEEVSDDDILYIIDTIWDWYEKNGYTDINSDITDEEALDIDGLVAYVRKELRRAGETLMNPDDVYDIVKAEIQYEESIEDF